eukprot:Skav206334  [mRNA]  locus=scaffold1420:359109:363701:+ [translate_table: standard]
MDFHSLDDLGCHMPSLQAFESGLRIDLECMGFTSGYIVAQPASASMPQFQIRCACPDWSTRYIDVGRQFTVVQFKRVMVDDRLVLRAQHGDLLPILHPTNASECIAEAFAGLGGWSWGASLYGAAPVLMVDSNQTAAEACARGHGLVFMGIDSAMQFARDGMLPERLVVVADILDVRVWFLAGIMHVANWLASPPCPPWSTASRQAGLDAYDGAVFAKFLYMLGVSHARSVSLENVPGLPQHPHFSVLRDVVLEAGMKMVINTVDKVHPLLPVMRSRWLATCVRSDVKIDDQMILRAKNMTFPSSVLGVGKENSLGAAGAMQNYMQPWERQQCTPSEEAMEAMQRPDFLPVSLRRPGYANMSASEVLKLRTKTSRQLLPSVMAMQGSQHLLPEELLKSKGLHAFVLRDGFALRFVTPFEVGFALGFPKDMWLPTDFRDAWQLTGNALSIAHAALQCARTRWIVGEKSGIPDEVGGIFDICKKVLDFTCSLDGLHVTVQGAWMCMMPPMPSAPPTVVETVLDDDDEDAGTAEGSPARVIAPVVSPTVAFSIHDDTNDIGKQHDGMTRSTPMLVPGVSDRPLEALFKWTLATSKPDCGGLEFQQTKVQIDGANRALFHVLHSQNIWACSFEATCPIEVGKVIKGAFPHASSAHFVEILVNHERVWFHTILDLAQSFEIVFRPCSFPRVVSPCFMEKDVVCEVDVAWTFADLSAFVATQAGVFASNVQCSVADTICAPEAFVLAMPYGSFDAEIVQTTVPGVCADPIKSSYRLTTRHPKWGSIRSGVFAADEELRNVILELLPGFDDDKTPVVLIEGKCVPPNSPVCMLTKDMVVHFRDEKLKDEMLIMAASSPVDPCSCQTVQVHYRSPFAFRAQVQDAPASWSVLDFIDSLLQPYPCSMTLTVAIGGCGVDVKRPIANLQPSDVLDIRACGLPGGAKNPDNATRVLHEMLTSRGVPEDVVASRITLIKSNIPAAELNSILAMDSAKAWTTLKGKANDTKMRLVTTVELKAFQKAQRMNGGGRKPDAASSSTQPKPKTSAKKANTGPMVVSIDPGHFKADGFKLPLLNESQWGPDARGILVTTPDAATKRLPVNKLSVDPLALVVVTGKPFHGMVPVTVPATDGVGRPTLSSVVVINFGDTQVTCQPQLLTAELPVIHTAILEISIVRQLVAQWSEVKNVHNYLGLQLPELRKDKVIATWAFKAYNKDRAQAQHEHAVYIHGFARVTEDVLIATLQRSGKAGIFLQVKDASKKPDARFGVITLHGASIEEALKQAGAVKNALGVVQLGKGGPFAIRARREHLTEIRQHVLPQSIAMQEGSVPSDATWWLLKHVQASTTCADLTKALKTLGWDASVIKPAGRSAWLACAQNDPPATHLCLGTDYVAVVPLLQTKHAASNDSPEVAMVPAPANFSMCPEDDTAATTTATRMSDLEERLTDMINMKVSTVAATVEEVKGKLQHVVDETRKEFVEVREQQSAIQTSIQTQIQSSNNGLLEQMQNMFQKMQQDLTSTIQARQDANMEDEKEKRARTS